MNIIEIDENYNNKIINEEYVCSFGSFDGFHLGHQQLLNECLKLTKLKKACFFFDIPFSFVRDNSHSFLLSLSDKIQFLQELNFDTVFIMKLNENTMKINKDEFIKRYIINNNIKYVVVGSDFTFGYRKEGNSDTLLSYSNNFKTCVVPLLEIDNIKVSTTEIKKQLINGNIELANRYLDREYTIKGTITKGLNNGTKLGFKTANLNNHDNYLIPKIGAYATYIYIDNKKYLSMTNVGYHPTIDKLKEISIETNIFDYDSDIYSKNVSLSFLEYIREEKQFSSLKELIDQLNKDKEYTQNKFKK